MSTNPFTRRRHWFPKPYADLAARLRVTAGFVMVAAFSFGLALTMVTTGVIAAWSARRAERKFRGFGEFMRRAPYLSCGLMLVIAAYMGWHGWRGLRAWYVPIAEFPSSGALHLI